ncbi:hypothetical protein FIU94_16660 [Sulfitobacter sp. THAF37]|nr:hypothetical protein FIU94_16660 [Sulfitobacter sp. THAF37]
MLGLNLAFSLALDVVLAYAVASLLGPNDFWTTFFVMLGIFWFGPIPFAIKGNIYKLLLQQFNKNSVRTSLVQSFREAQLPLLSGTEFNDPADLYFREVANDDELPKSARLYAGVTMGQMSILNQYSMVDTLMLHSNLDAALAQYFDEMRRDGVKPHGLDNKALNVGKNEGEGDLDEQADLVASAKLNSEIGQISARALREDGIDDTQMNYERDKYFEYRSQIEEIMEKMGDDFYFGAAFHQYAKLVCAAGEPELAMQYLPRVDENFLQKFVLPDLPELAELASSEKKT